MIIIHLASLVTLGIPIMNSIVQSVIQVSLWLISTATRCTKCLSQQLTVRQNAVERQRKTSSLAVFDKVISDNRSLYKSLYETSFNVCKSKQFPTQPSCRTCYCSWGSIGEFVNFVLFFRFLWSFERNTSKYPSSMSITISWSLRAPGCMPNIYQVYYFDLYLTYVSRIKHNIPTGRVMRYISRNNKIIFAKCERTTILVR